MDVALKDVRASCRGGKNIIVRFASAHCGHGVDVVLNRGPNHVYLKECNQDSIDFIERYHYRIAAVVINPMQHFTGIHKRSPPKLGARVRESTNRNEYAQWLHDLQDKCQYCTRYLTRVALIMDDVYFAFRTPELFSFQYFTHPQTGQPLRPDLIVLGKSVAAGYPLSMVLSRKCFLNSLDKNHLFQVNKTVGTTAAWYGGLVASSVFLENISSENSPLLQISAQEQLRIMVSKFDAFAQKLNSRLVTKDLPLRIMNFSNTFAVNYLSSSLYNCRFPQYLMAQGVCLSNDSTGKFHLNADATEADLDKLADKFVAAAMRMKDDGYFEPPGATEFCIISRIAGWLFVNSLRVYYERMMQDKRIDIEVSHHHPVNKFGHFWSSVFMILLAYPYMFMGMSVKACAVFFVTHVVRQSGKFFYEHNDCAMEKMQTGHKDTSKKAAVALWILAALVYHYRAVLVLAHVERYAIPELNVDQYVSLVALLTIVPHFVEITHQLGFLRGVEWIVKIWTDPFTDLIDFYPYCVIDPRWFLVAPKDQNGHLKAGSDKQEGQQGRVDEPFLSTMIACLEQYAHLINQTQREISM